MKTLEEACYEEIRDGFAEDSMGDTSEPGPFGFSAYDFVVVNYVECVCHWAASGEFRLISSGPDARNCWNVILENAVRAAIQNGDFEYFGCKDVDELQKNLEDWKK